MIANRLSTSENAKEKVRVLQRKLYLKAKSQSTFRLERFACLRKKSIGKPYA
jgi:hypothetical protein